MKQKIFRGIVLFYVVVMALPGVVLAESVVPASTQSSAVSMLSEGEALALLGESTVAGNQPIEAVALSQDEMRETEGARWKPRRNWGYVCAGLAVLGAGVIVWGLVGAEAVATTLVL